MFFPTLTININRGIFFLHSKPKGNLHATYLLGSYCWGLNLSLTMIEFGLRNFNSGWTIHACLIALLGPIDTHITLVVLGTVLQICLV